LGRFLFQQLVLALDFCHARGKVRGGNASSSSSSSFVGSCGQAETRLRLKAQKQRRGAVMAADRCFYSLQRHTSCGMIASIAHCL
jgi:hypothetical protein